MELDLPPKLRKALEKEASEASRTLHAHIVRKLEGITPPVEGIDRRPLEKGLPKLVDFLRRVPGVRVLSSDITPDAYWWVKFEVDIDHKLSWNVVQELGYVLNEISVTEKLPTVLKPVSPPPYMNGGPREFLSWVVESKFNYIDPNWILQELEGRLPNPVDDENAWRSGDEA